jgi:hypothetical protein
VWTSLPTAPALSARPSSKITEENLTITNILSPHLESSILKRSLAGEKASVEKKLHSFLPSLGYTRANLKQLNQLDSSELKRYFIRWLQQFVRKVTIAFMLWLNTPLLILF